MQFKHSSQRNMHESMIHRGMFEKAADKWIKSVISNAQPSDLQKKVFGVGSQRFSYDDISKMNTDSDEYRKVQDTLIRFITDWLDNRPNHTIDDFFRILRFSIIDG